MSSALNSTFEAAAKIGDMMPDGHAHAGLIYFGTLLNDPGDERDTYVKYDPAAGLTIGQSGEWADRQGGKLMTLKEGDKFTAAIKGNSNLAKHFNLSGSFPAGFVWLAEPFSDRRTWCQRLSDGRRSSSRNDKLPALCVVRR